MRSGLLAKSIYLEIESFRTKTCLSLERKDSSREPSPESDDIVFARDKVDVRVELFNIIETANDMVRGVVVSGNVEVIGMDVYHGTKKLMQNSIKTMRMERSSLSPTV